MCLLLLVFLSGCAFKAKAWKDKDEVWHYESNQKSSFKVTPDSFEGDGRGEPFIKLPDIQAAKLGG